MDLTNYVNNEVFGPIEVNVKADIWKTCRNLVTETFLNRFKQSVVFAQKLYKISNPMSNFIKPSKMAATFSKIEKIDRTITSYPIRGSSRLLEIMLTMSGNFLLEEDMFECFFGLVNKWIGLLYKCNENPSCHSECQCGVKYCEQVITQTGVDFNDICKYERPGQALFEAWCSTMITRCSSLLEELNNFIPAYCILDQCNSDGLRKFLMENGIGFQITFTHGHLLYTIQNEDDRCNAKSLKQLIMLAPMESYSVVS